MKSKRNAFASWFLQKNFWIQTSLVACTLFLIVSGILVIWVATLRIPDLQSFQNRVLAGSTQIYDRTGEILLYNLNQDVKQQVVPLSEISQHVKDATIAIEDEKFYEHKGIQLTSIIRAIFANLQSLRFSQGGSTITQQVIKNSLLTTDKRISRKIKEWVLALKLERVMSKDDILNLYLNSTSYGGNHYGIEEASRNFLGKSAKDLTIAESAYLAALPQAPSRYSPYGNNKNLLENRKNLVLEKMKENGFITEKEYQGALKEQVVFKKQDDRSIKAPHFVMYIKQYLVDTYGEDVVKNGGLKIVTTLDYEMQQKAEEIVKKYALENNKNFNAENAAMVAIDPTTGQILTMVGSRDYFDAKIEGNFNVAIAHRQPGSAFKPFAYVTAFSKGYTPDTVLFDLPTQFSTTCDANGNQLSSDAVCYTPENYDHKFRGPISLRNALAQSINIPAIKLLYLAGLKDTLQTAQDMGITSLDDINRYGLTLVLGGGEVSPLEMTSAYGVFAANGIRNPPTGILKVTDRNGKVLEEFSTDPKQVLATQPVLELNNVLYDNNARLALNGPGSATDFPDREVALKTGTTNDSRDAWIIGYTPQIVVGAWAGNNNNAPMIKKNPATSGLIVAPMWRAFMNEVLATIPPVSFTRPDPIDTNLRPILRGVWQGGQIYTVDKTSGKLATDFTPPELREERAVPNIHNILYWVDRNNPTGPAPSRPENDPQFNLWEPPVLAWAAAHSGDFSGNYPPTQIDDVHGPEQTPTISFNTPSPNANYAVTSMIPVSINYQSVHPITKVEFYINNTLVNTASNPPFAFSFIPKDTPSIQGSNTLKAVAYDSVQNKSEAYLTFTVSQ